MEIISEPITEQVINDLKLSLKSFRPDNSVAHLKNEEVFDRARPKSDRFLINMYERPSTSVSRQHIACNGSVVKPEKNKLSSACDNTDKKYVLRKKSDSYDEQKRTMDQYMVLRSRRDVECLKLKEASNIVHYLNKHRRHGMWEERILAEKFLLESGLAVDVLKRKIAEDYVSVTEKEIQIGTISLSNFKFHLRRQQLKHDETEFFVLVLLSETDIRSSKIARPSSGEIVFDEEFKFAVSRNFKIKIQLNSIVMKETSPLCSIATLLRIKNYYEKRTFSKLYYKNLNTCDFEESKVLRTSFKLCADVEVVASNLHNKIWDLNLMEGCMLNESAYFSAEVKDFKIEYRCCGFLTYGYIFKDYIVWNRRWCILDGSLLKIYNSPTEEAECEPQIVLDLVDCPLHNVTEASRTECSRRRSLIVTISQKDRTDKYYFLADNMDDLKKWLDALNLILDLLQFKNSYKL